MLGCPDVVDRNMLSFVMKLSIFLITGSQRLPVILFNTSGPIVANAFFFCFRVRVLELILVIIQISSGFGAF